MYKDSEICDDPQFLKDLEVNLIETHQDDDVDSEEEVLECAYNNCITDLN